MSTRVASTEPAGPDTHIDASNDPLLDARALDVVFVSGEPLRHDDAVSAVTDAACGAISTFLGTTRDSHGERLVLRLTYEAHETMAVRVIREVVAEARARSGGRIRRVFVAHRVGEVPVGCCSVRHARGSPASFALASPPGRLRPSPPPPTDPHRSVVSAPGRRSGEAARRRRAHCEGPRPSSRDRVAGRGVVHPRRGEGARACLEARGVRRRRARVERERRVRLGGPGTRGGGWR